MGEVYRARDTKLDRAVAIKVLPHALTRNPERLARFEREARVLASLNHPNIATVYSLEESPDGKAIAMELVEGSTLKSPLPVPEAVKTAVQIAEALEVAHEKGITHRDLKPGNIMVTPAGFVKVLDFGLAAVARPSGENSEHSPTLTMGATQAGMIMGTAAYMAPEQAAGQAVDRRADIWSFGVVLWEMLTGERLFRGETVSHILANVINQEIDFKKLPAAIPASVRTLLARCLERDVKTRLQWIGEARIALQRYHSEPAAAAAVSNRSLVPWTIAAGIFLALAALGFVHFRETVPEKTAIRLDLDLGEDRTVRAGVVSDIALSDDGKQIAYLAQDRLFVRRLDEAQARELPGTAGAASPVFSPDGQWVAFAAGGKLRKISVNGGAAVDVTDAPFLLGVAWADERTIITGVAQNASLVQVPASGGTPTPVTELDGERRERTHRYPQVLQGGKALLYTWNLSAVSGWDEGSIDVMTLADRQRKTLIRGGTFGRYLETGTDTGFLLYVSRGTLFAAPFDEAALELRGDPTPVIERVSYSPITGAAKLAISPTGTIVFESGASAEGLSTIQWLDESGKTTPVLATPGLYGRPSLSPDGRRVAMEWNQDIWVLDVARGTTTRLTFDGSANLGPIWTPDGMNIVFQQPDGLWLTRADGSAQAQSLFKSKGPVFPYSFTPDGKRMAYIELGPQAYDLWTVPVQTENGSLRAGTPEPFLQTPFDERYPMISPDGRWVAFVSTQSGRFEVYVRPMAGAAAGGGQWQISNGGAGYPQWSRTRPELFFETLDSRVMVASYRTQGDSFLADTPRLWSEKQISNSVNTSKNLDLAPDGKRFLVVMPVEDAGAAVRNRLTMIENFGEELRRRVPVK